MTWAATLAPSVSEMPPATGQYPRRCQTIPQVAASRPAWLGQGERDVSGVGYPAGLNLLQMIGGADEQRVWSADDSVILVVVAELDQEAADRLEPRALLVVALDHRPGCVLVCGSW